MDAPYHVVLNARYLHATCTLLLATCSLPAAGEGITIGDSVYETLIMRAS